MEERNIIPFFGLAYCSKLTNNYKVKNYRAKTLSKLNIILTAETIDNFTLDLDDPDQIKRYVDLHQILVEKYANVYKIYYYMDADLCDNILFGYVEENNKLFSIIYNCTTNRYSLLPVNHEPQYMPKLHESHWPMREKILYQIYSGLHAGKFVTVEADIPKLIN